MEKIIRHSLFTGFVIALLMLSFGCATSNYTVTVDNQSSKSVLARIERRPSMNNMIVLDSEKITGEDLVVLGPVKAPLLERVYIVIQSPENLHAIAESHKLMPGSYRVTVSSGSVTSWGAYEVSVERE